MELEVQRLTATRSAEEMTTEMSQPIAKRKVEPKDKKRELEEYVGKDMARSSFTARFRAGSGATLGQSHVMDRNLGRSRGQSD